MAFFPETLVIQSIIRSGGIISFLFYSSERIEKWIWTLMLSFYFCVGPWVPWCPDEKEVRGPTNAWAIWCVETSHNITYNNKHWQQGSISCTKTTFSSATPSLFCWWRTPLLLEMFWMHDFLFLFVLLFVISRPHSVISGLLYLKARGNMRWMYFQPNKSRQTKLAENFLVWIICVSQRRRPVVQFIHTPTHFSLIERNKCLYLSPRSFRTQQARCRQMFTSADVSETEDKVIRNSARRV